MSVFNLKNNRQDVIAYLADLKCIRNQHDKCYEVANLFSNDSTLISLLLQPLFNKYYSRLENK